MAGFLSNLVTQAVPAATGFLKGLNQAVDIEFERELARKAEERAAKNAETQEGFLRQQMEASRKEEIDLAKEVREREEAAARRAELLGGPEFADLSPALRAFYGRDDSATEKLIEQRRKEAAGPAPPSPGEARASTNFRQSQERRKMDAMAQQAERTAAVYARQAAAMPPEDAEMLKRAAIDAIADAYGEAVDPIAVVEEAFGDAGGGFTISGPVGPPGEASVTDQTLDQIIGNMSPEEIAALLRG